MMFSRYWQLACFSSFVTLFFASESQLQADTRDTYTVRTHKDASGEISRYLLFQPISVRPTSGYPVIMFLNGFGENGTDGLRQVSNNFGVDVYRFRQRFPFIAICPQCSPNGNWAANGQDAKRALDILEEVIQECGGDPDRVCLTGVSAGGAGVWEIAAAHPDRFAPLWPISAGSSVDLSPIAEQKIPTWCFYNAADRERIVNSARQANLRLLQGGLSPMVTEYDRAGHDAWTEAYRTTVVFEWLLKQSRSNNQRAGRYRLWSPEELLTSWQMEASDGNTGHAPGDADEQDQRAGTVRLASPPQSGDSELHAELQLEPGASREVFLLDASSKLLAHFRLELPVTGTGRIAVGAEPSKPLDPVAQRSLRSGWNDVRFVKQGPKLSLQLNGWTAAEFALPVNSATFRWTIQLASPQEVTGWRNLRTRESLTSP